MNCCHGTGRNQQQRSPLKPPRSSPNAYVELNGTVLFSIAITESQQYAPFIIDNYHLFGRAQMLRILMSGADTLTGGSGSDNLSSLTAAPRSGQGSLTSLPDYIFGMGGADTIIGDQSNDHLYGHSAAGGTDGADLIIDTGGNDYIQGNAGSDTVTGGSGSDRVNGGADGDTLYGDQFLNLINGALEAGENTAGPGHDTINGNRGNDLIFGDAGNDFLRGGQDSDTIDGGNGDDIVQGDLGQDRLTGGLGVDRFIFTLGSSTKALPDSITDFATGTDKISIGFQPTVLLLATNNTDPSNALQNAQAAASSRPGDKEAVAVDVGQDLYLFYASNGSNLIDSAIILSGRSNSDLSLSDFI